MYDNLIWSIATANSEAIVVFMFVALAFSWLRSLLFKD